MICLSCATIPVKNAEVTHIEPIQYEQRGYLNESFRLFYLADDHAGDIEYHYHTFHKIILLLAGLNPGDFVLVGRGSIHRPVVADGDYYERMILYISPACLEALAVDDCDPSECFRLAQQSFQYVYRDGPDSRVRQLFQSLHQTIVRGGYGASLLTQAQFTELLVEVNRLCRAGHGVGAAGGDSKVVSLLQYLNLHLSEPLSIDDLSARFYISKYHMMRRFRQETGYSIHGYLSEKRLLLAQQLLSRGAAPSEVFTQVGYQDYSTFSRAYKKQFGRSPSADAEKEHDLQVTTQDL